ncbi:MAG: zinc ABC transporter substrate-binding protein [Acidimicrobiia bacterium]|nr:zinc ABC transporter substrate-binding protein [Acidimicrobiia bacterium]
MPRRPALALLGVVAAALTFVACGGSPSADSGGETLAVVTKPLVIATTPIVGDLVSRVAGDRVAVETLMPPGADPHDFEPSAAQAARLRRAALIVENGLGLEQRLQPAIDAAEREGVPVLSLGELLDPLPLDESGDAHGHGADDDHAHSGETAVTDAALDPHVWLDPERMARAAMIVAAELARVTNADDATAATLRNDAQQYAAAALAAATTAEQLLAAIPEPRRILVTNHDALGYFANRFGLTVKGVIVPGGSTQAEPSAAEVADLVKVLRATRVPAIFTESTTSSRLPDTIARDAGGNVRVVVVTTDTLGRTGAADSTYAGLITELARRIADGLRST